jgi:dienelactone hydrolase
MDIGQGPERAPPTTIPATQIEPRLRAGTEPMPAVILLHGSAGILEPRELTYGRQLASMGVAVLIIDSFAPRRHLAASYSERLVHITETMIMNDAYAGLAYLAGLPGIDAGRVALLGFSYGAMATLYAAFDQVAGKLGAEGRRFAGHVAFYPPCIATFANTRTTEAPVLILIGGRDTVSDQTRCAATAEDMRRGGSEVEVIVYPEAAHQWDGGALSERAVSRTPAACRLRVDADGAIEDENTGLPMTTPLFRRLILAACMDGAEPYPIVRDNAVRAKSNQALGDFLARVLTAGGS